ncbi:MAG: trypsin-like peptidase domain-containing protein [Deltaproteobacteria bacterium]|nr:trypsin-like peptidase domain-containing protein [Deltaproteobacteria bacterium]
MNLVPGQRVKLAELTSESRVLVRIRARGAVEVQNVALLLSEAYEALSPRSVVADQKSQSDCGGVVAEPPAGLEQVFRLDLSRLDKQASTLLFGLALFEGSRKVPAEARKLESLSWTLEAGGREVARFELQGRNLGSETALSLGELYRKQGVWRVRATGDGFVGGLSTMLSRFRINSSALAGGLDSLRAPNTQQLQEGARSFEQSPICLPKVYPGDRAPVVPKSLTRSVGLVVTKTAEGVVHTGTGFAISPGGHFVTCNHVVEDAVEIAICLDGTRTLRPAEVVGRHEESDLAMCWIADRNGSAEWLVLGGRDEEPNLGDELGLLGYPLGVNLGMSVTYSQGIINSLRKRGDVSVLQIDVGAAPGSSGGPIFRRSDGKVVAVLTSGLDVERSGMLINFSTDLRTLWTLGWLSESQ